MSPSKLLSVKQASEQSGLPQQAIYILCNEKRLAHLRVGAKGKRGRVFIKPEDLEEAVKRLRVEVHPLLKISKKVG